MTVPLDIFNGEARHKGIMDRVWDPFMHHANTLWQQHLEQQGIAEEDSSSEHWDQFLVQLLAQYSAHTDWNDEEDPIWFEDEHSLVTFVLTWSK